MASPQTENGYTRFANELMDAVLAFPFTQRQIKVILAIIRKTYGYNKKVDDLSLSQIAKITHMDKVNCSRAINELEKMRVIIRKDGHFGHIIGINKDYEAWRVPAKERRGVAKITTLRLPKRQP